MLSRVFTSGIIGIEGYEVVVECSAWDRIPRFDLVGLPDAAVKEAKNRVQSACENSGFKFPALDIMVNLAPADRKKEGSGFDLAILAAILQSDRIIPANYDFSDKCLVGELSLSGEVRSIGGVLPMTASARDAGKKEMFVPYANAKEAAVVDGITVYGVKTLRQLINHITGKEKISPELYDKRSFERERHFELDFSEVRGQLRAKRALEVAAAGGHNVLMIGPPGAGKSMLAKRLPTILPEMTFSEAVETTKIHSVMGMLKSNLISERPFRSPHHTASASALAGGGPLMRPGEISLAHNGVLFMDELPEFRRDVLEALRQPLEDGDVTVARAGGTLHLPARFQLVCAMNPCRCGWRGHPSGRCRCSDRDVEKYVEKISGPLLDRIDLHVSVPSVEYEMMRRKETPEPSAAVKQRVDKARAIQEERFAGSQTTCNAYMTPAQIKAFCPLDPAGDALMKNAFTRMGLTARSHDKVLRLARTIADLEGEENISAIHLAEAIQYRNTDILKS